MTHSTEPAGGPIRVMVFPTTHWSVVVQAGGNLGGEAARALERLCQCYWYPLYAYVRRKGYSPADAEDLTQEFFTRLLQKNYLSTVDQKKGRFRSFLLASLEHFLAKEWNRAHRLKRGGRCTFISLDDHSGEDRYLLEPRHEASPETLYDRNWALAVLERALERLGSEYAEAGKADLFGQLKSFLSGDRDEQNYVEAAGRLQMSQGAARVAVHRLRSRYGELLRAEIAETVVRPEDIDEELHQLLCAVAP